MFIIISQRLQWKMCTLIRFHATILKGLWSQLNVWKLSSSNLLQGKIKLEIKCPVQILLSSPAKAFGLKITKAVRVQQATTLTQHQRNTKTQTSTGINSNSWSLYYSIQLSTESTQTMNRSFFILLWNFDI